MTTPKAPTQESVEKALLSLELGTAWSSTQELDADIKTIRSHIAAQASMIKCQRIDLAGLRRLDYRVTTLKDEVERLRGVLNTCEGRILNAQIGINTGDTKAELSKYLDAVLDIIRKALNPEQKGGE
jgi:uncharacterized small protein (DUF1192 family)